MSAARCSSKAGGCLCVAAIDCEHDNRLERAATAVRDDDAMGAWPKGEHDAVARRLALAALDAAEVSA